MDDGERPSNHLSNASVSGAAGDGADEADETSSFSWDFNESFASHRKRRAMNGLWREYGRWCREKDWNGKYQEKYWVEREIQLGDYSWNIKQFLYFYSEYIGKLPVVNLQV